MKPLVYHVKSRVENLWEAKRAYRHRATVLAPTQDEAVKRIVEIIGDKKAQVVVHAPDGRIQEELICPRGGATRNVGAGDERSETAAMNV